MPNPLQIKLAPEYEQNPTDGSLCSECHLVIASTNMYQLVMFINYEPVYTKFKYCETCYSVINDTG